MTTPDASKDVQQLKLACIGDKSIKQYHHFGKLFLVKLYIHLTYDPVFLLLTIYSRNTKTRPQEDMYKNVHRKQSKRPSNRRINKQIVAYSYSEILLGNKKEHNTDIHNNMNESQKNIMLSEKSQERKSTYYMIPFKQSSRTGKSNVW